MAVTHHQDQSITLYCLRSARKKESFVKHLCDPRKEINFLNSHETFLKDHQVAERRNESITKGITLLEAVRHLSKLRQKP